MRVFLCEASVGKARRTKNVCRVDCSASREERLGRKRWGSRCFNFLLSTASRTTAAKEATSSVSDQAGEKSAKFTSFVASWPMAGARFIALLLACLLRQQVDCARIGDQSRSNQTVAEPVTITLGILGALGSVYSIRKSWHSHLDRTCKLHVQQMDRS